MLLIRPLTGSLIIAMSARLLWEIIIVAIAIETIVLGLVKMGGIKHCPNHAVVNAVITKAQRKGLL